MSVMSLNYIVCMFSVGIWCDDKWQFGHFCLWCAEAAKLILSLRAISSSSVFRVPWLRGPRVRPAPRRPRPPQPSRSCRPSPASSSRWPLTPKRMKIYQIKFFYCIELKSKLSVRLILCHLCLSIARLDLEQRSYVLERRGVLLQLGVTDGEVVQVVSLVRLVTVLRAHKQYDGCKHAHVDWMSICCA